MPGSAQGGGHRKAGGVRAAVAAVYDELGLPEATIVALGFTLVGAMALMVLRNSLVLLLSYAPKAMALRSTLGRYLQPVAELAKPVVETMFGSATLTVKLEHVLLVALLIVLVGMWRTTYTNGQLLRRLAERDASEAAAVAGDDGGEPAGEHAAGGAADGGGEGVRRRGGRT